MPIIRRLLESMVGALLSVFIFNLINQYFKRYDEREKKQIEVIEAVIVE